MKRKALIIAIILIGVIGVLFRGNDVFADVDGSKIVEKWFLTQYIQCASTEKGGILKHFANQSETNRRNEEVAKIIFEGSSIKMPLPSYNYGGMKSDDNGINCDEMFRGGSNKTSKKGLLSFSSLDGAVKWNDAGERIDDFLNKLGYKKTDNNTETIQISLIKHQTGKGFDNTSEMKLGEVISYNTNTGNYSIDQKSYFDYFKFTVDNNKKIITVESNVRNQHSGQSCGLVEESFTKKDIEIGANFNVTVNNIKNELGGLRWTFNCINDMKIEYRFPPADEFVTTGTLGTYDYDDTRSTLNNAIKNMTGLNGVQGTFLSSSERYTLYLYYLQMASNNDIVCDVDSHPNTEQIKIKDSSGKINKNCYVNLNGKSPGEFPVFIQSVKVDNHSVPKIEKKSLQDVINWLNNVPDSELTDVTALGDINNGVDPGDLSDDSEMNCANSGGAESLGWIVCPIMKFLSDGANKAYNDVVEPSLRVDPKLFSGNDGGVYQGWETFRNIANVLFIILLLVVIFSQLTGVGIDNYGIKKILPKLIIAAILINLSYLICLLFVDLSNIFGNSLRSLFDGLGANLKPVLDIPESNANGEVGATAITGVAVLGTLAVMVGAVWQNPAIILSLLVAALGVAISIFFLFILLSVREAAIVVLVAVSPLAVVFYTLPNTKKIFDKWLKFFEGLLLVYPICGLLVGGGNYVSKLLLSAGFGGDGFLNAFTAMIVGIVPIFFIPTVLKGSFAAMGAIGGKLAGLGNAARRGVTGKVRGSEAYKNAQKMGLDRKMRYKAGYSERKGGLTATGILKSKVAQSRFGRMTGMNKRQAAYVETAKKNADIGKESTAILMSEAAAADLARSGMAPKEYFQDRINKVGTDIRKLDSVISAAQKRGVKNKDIMAMIRKASNNGSLKFASGASRLNWMNSMLQNHNDITSTDFEGQEWMRAGGSGPLGNYGDYAAGNLNASDIDISDLSKIAGNSMAGLIKAGMISESVAQQWLAANPNASPDKKIMMGAVASGAVTSTSLAGIDAEAFKNEAEALANGATPATNVIETGVNVVNANLTSQGHTGIDLADRVASWTAQQQARTYISQDASSMAPGQLQREEDPVFVHEVGGSTRNRSATAMNNMHNEYLAQQGTSAAELEEINRNLRR